MKVRRYITSVFLVPINSQYLKRKNVCAERFDTGYTAFFFYFLYRYGKQILFSIRMTTQP